MPDGEIVADKTLGNPNYTTATGGGGARAARDSGATYLPGHQLRYVYFLDKSEQSNLAVPIIPYSEIAKRGAGMYLGKPRAGSVDSGTLCDQQGGAGATPTPALLELETANG